MKQNLFSRAIGRQVGCWVLFWAVCASASAVEKGDSYESVIAELGKPSSEMKAGRMLVLSYNERRVQLLDGKVVKVDAIRHYAIDDSAGAQAAKEAHQDRSKSATIGVKVIEIRNNGAREDLRRFIVPGQITVIGFFADWCGPCKLISPQLEALAEDRSEVYLRKIDVVDWNSPIVKQFGIHAIPRIVVFDKKGQPMTDGTSSIREVLNLIDKASS